MEKCKIMPLIHKYTLQVIQPNKYPWGWRPQNEIKKILDKTPIYKYQPNMFDDEIKSKTKLNEYQFIEGAKQGYKIIFEHFKNKKDFISENYTTPELSRALNYINTIQKSHNITFQEPSVKILTSSILIEYAKSNDKIFGYFDIKELKKNIPANLWDVYVGPLKQNVKVLYQIDDEMHIWDWERSLMGDDYWTVSNINEVLI